MLWSPRWAWHHVGTILCCLDSLPILSLASLLAVVQLFFFSFSFSGCAGSSLWHAGISSVARGFCGPPGMCDLSFPTRDTTHVSRIGRWILNHWTTKEVPDVHSHCRKPICTNVCLSPSTFLAPLHHRCSNNSVLVLCSRHIFNS